MNHLLVILLAWIVVGMETGLRDVLEVGQRGVAPSFVLPLLVLIGLTAAPTAVVWTGILLGLAMDLLWPMPGVHGATAVTLLGPHALGYALAAHLVLALRGMMIRRNLLTVGFLAVTGGMVAQIGVVAVVTARGMLGEAMPWQPGAEVLRRFGCVLASFPVAIAMALLLFPVMPFLGLPFGAARAARH